MVSLKDSVKLTKRYAAFFHGQLTNKDLHRFLISDQIHSEALLKKRFPQRPKSRPNYSVPKIALAREVTKLISHIPSILMVTVTGSLAVNNAKLADDVDLMIVTTRDTLWLTRPLVTFLISLFFKLRTSKTNQIRKSDVKNSVCLNLWLDELALSVPNKKRNLYTAHEVLQALPIFERGGCYQRFITANSWSKKYLANGYQIARTIFSNQKPRSSSTGNFIFSFLNLLAFKIQYLYMKEKITNETISLHAAYFHPRDLSVIMNSWTTPH